MAEFFFMSETQKEEFYKDYLAEIKSLIGQEVKINNDTTHYQITAGSRIVAGWYLQEMPGCCGICVSTGAYVMPDFRKKGIGSLLNKLRIAIATELKYGLLLCTDVADNTPQQRILEKNGWDKIDVFSNPKTDNIINVHTIKLNQGPTEEEVLDKGYF